MTIEFYAQGDAERSEGIAVTPIMDRYTTTPQAKFQVNDLKNFILVYEVIISF